MKNQKPLADGTSETNNQANYSTGGKAIKIDNKQSNDADGRKKKGMK